jgi:hypothetical protein
LKAATTAGGKARLVGRVRLQLVPQCCEDERLEQVLHDAQRHRGTHDGEVPRGGDRDDVDGVPCGPQCPADVQPVHVRQAHVEQHEVNGVTSGPAQPLKGLQRLLTG